MARMSLVSVAILALLTSAALAAPGKEKKVLADFENESDVKLIKPDPEQNAVTIERSEQWASSGKASLKITCKADQQGASFELDQSLLKGWEKFDYLAIDFYTEDKQPTIFIAELWDANTKGYPTRATYEDANALPPVHKGKNTVLIDLRNARLNGREAVALSKLTAADRVDLAKLTHCRFWLRTLGRKTDLVVYMDNVRLLQEGALETNMKIDLPAGATAFDFGTKDSPVVEGFTAVTAADVFGGEKAFGFVDPKGIAGMGKDYPDPLTGDCVGPAMIDGAPQPANWEFRAKLPNGKYLALVSAYYFPYPGLDTELKLGGKSYLESKGTGPDFYTEKNFFRFLNYQYSEKPNALWKDVVSKCYPMFEAPVEVTDGAVKLEGKNVYIAALILLPADKKDAAAKLAQQIEAERIKYFYKDLWLLRPENEPVKAADKELTIFAPAEGKNIMPWSGMDDADAQEITRVAVPGETVYFQVALRPFKDISKAKVSLLQLKPAGSDLPKAEVNVFLKQYITNGTNVYPWVLLPKDTFDLEKDVTRSVWVQMKIPDNYPAREFNCSLVVNADGLMKGLDVKITVLPIKLRADIPIGFGLYYGPPDSGQFALMDKMPDFQAQRDKMFQEQMELCHELGLDSMEFPSPTVKEIKDGKAVLDFSACDKFAKQAKAAGLFKQPKHYALSATLNIGREIGGLLLRHAVKPGEEFTAEGFEKPYLDAMAQFVEYGKKNQLPLVLWLVDEPRENPNPWNRNLADTIRYCDLAGKIPGAVRMIDPMGDVNSDKDYLSLLDHVDIIDTHAGPASEKFITTAVKNRKPELWIYNTGKDRFSNGFYVWRAGATGKHEWHFSQWNYENPGKYPGKDLHNPLMVYEIGDATAAAPLNYRGGLLPKESLFTMAAGVNDYRYIWTLQQAIGHINQKENDPLAPIAAEAQKFLDDLKTKIPLIPEVKNLTDLAAVGEGISGGGEVENWKRKVGEYIVKLQKP